MEEAQQERTQNASYEYQVLQTMLPLSKTRLAFLPGSSCAQRCVCVLVHEVDFEWQL